MARFALATLPNETSSRPAYTLSVLAAGLLATVVLSGCGIGNKAVETTQSIATPTLNGKTFGGPNPIIGSTVKLYTTGDSTGTSTGYGVAFMRQEANAVTNPVGYPSGDTDLSGKFTFAGGYTCPAGQFAYIVAAGGNTGASGSAGGATATSVINGITSIAVNSGGTAYTATPTVTITPAAGDTTGSGAMATASLTSGAVSKITITATGGNYTAAPTVTITPAVGDTTGSGATATAAYTAGTVTSITVTGGGAGYTTATVTITSADGPGSGATAAASISGSSNTTGAITSIAVTNGGSGYDVAPTVSISAPTGSVNPANANAVLVAALGRCEDLYASTSGGAYTGGNIFISELSTIAAAYSLGHFSNVTGSGSSTVVSIGAPASNNAAQISGVSTGCVAGVGSCTTTATAGLAHAFQNAANLVNVFQNPLVNGANSTVVAPPGTTSFYSNGSYTAAKPLVPQALINSLGNSLVTCVNSPGGVSGDGSSCGKIFLWTTLPSAVSSVIGNAGNSFSASAPINTFQAMANLAANPTMGESSSNVSGMFNLASAFTSVYGPALTASPGQDWTIAINYPESITSAVGTGVGNTTAGSTLWCATAPCQGLGFSPAGALDINDVFYVGNNSAIPSGAVPMNLLAFGSNGQLLGMTTNTSGGSGLKNAAAISVDTLGWGYVVTAGASGTNNFGYFKTGGGSIGTLTGGGALSGFTQKPITPTTNIYGTAVDKNNNVWLAGGSASVFELPESSSGPGATTTYTLPAALVPNTTVKNMGMQFDSNQNLWLVSGVTSVYVLQNTGTVGTPTYLASGGTTSQSTTVTPATGIGFVGTQAFVGGYNTTAGIQPFTPTISGAEVTSIAAGTLTTGSVVTGADLLQADGTGQLWVANYNNSSIAQLEFPAPYSTGTGYRIIPCVSATASATTCTTGVSSTTKPQFVVIDSAGSMWVGAGGNSSNTVGGALIEIIGTAAPTVPLLSLGLQGVTP